MRLYTSYVWTYKRTRGAIVIVQCGPTNEKACYVYKDPWEMGGGERSSTKHLLWLKFYAHHDHKFSLKCAVCSQKLVSMQNYQPAIVKGPPLADWDCTRALELWYMKKTS